ncbi:hypothetical protein LCGC14_0789700 [marine sediment metagenome]|uniref:Phage portal protein n=1 Tax=marine sediment metagenome TaxID=412755 RepID=A0A0F9PX88_9ZZZZ
MFKGIFTKALNAMRHSGPASFLLGLLSRTKFDYQKEIGTGIDASVVMAPIQWVQRAFPEAELRVVVEKDGAVEGVDGHELTALIRTPNSAYSGTHLWSATLFSYLTAGNAYWLKVRSNSGKVVELWYVPHWTIRPFWPDDGGEFISGYRYTPGGGGEFKIDPDDVVHFRHGIDPRNTRLGLSPLHSVIREIFTDVEASNFVAALLRNGGVPGVVISPDGDAVVGGDDAEAVKTWFKEEFGGDRRGAPLVMGAKTKVQEYGFSPDKMDLSSVRNVAEERVCASIGIPAAVVGFGAGLQQTKVGATMTELRKLAWINGIIPLHKSFSEEIARSLLPAFGGRAGLSVEFDLTGVTALEEDMNERAERFNIGVKGGWMLVADARRGMGLDVVSADEVYLRSVALVEVPVGETIMVLPNPIDPDNPKVVPFLRLTGRKDDHTEAERRAATNPSQKPTAGEAAYVSILARQAGPLVDAFEKRLKSFFDDLGEQVADVASPILHRAFGKVASEDVLLVDAIMSKANMAASEAVFKRNYEAHYLTVAEVGGEAADALGLATDLPDVVARAVLETGGKRVGLIDLTGKVKKSLDVALTEGRAAGEGADALVRRIREGVPAGPWKNSTTRSRVIARTETAFAQNTSTIERSKAAGIEKALVFDNLLGFDDDVCTELDGVVVTLAEARELAADEHPNGTRSFSPIVEQTV